MSFCDAPSKMPPNQLQGPFAQVIPLPMIKAGFAVKINCAEKERGFAFIGRALIFYKVSTFQGILLKAGFGDEKQRYLNWNP